jgi:hypothetical protein
MLAAVVSIHAASPGPILGRKPTFSDVNLIKAQTDAGYPYVVGGFSVEEKNAMERLPARYNLRLSFGRRSGVFAAPVALLIGNNNGHRIERVAVHAPRLYIQLPVGSYTVMARFAQQIVVVRDVYIREGVKRAYFLRGD